jgi:hypothetical protein
MFRMCADGSGLIAIAKTMNGTPGYVAEGRKHFGGRIVPPPRHGTGSWSPAAVRSILYRPIYRGELVWGLTTKTDRGGRAGISVKADREPLRVAAPALRIVDDALWAAAHRRLTATAEAYLRDARGRLLGKPDRPDLRGEGGYLLSSLAQCASCGENLVVVGGRERRYGCSGYIRRGVCTNDLRQPVTDVDASFLAALEREVMTPVHVRYTAERAVARLRERLAKDPECCPALERERKGLAQKIEHWAEAVGGDRALAAVYNPKIKAAQGRLEAIAAELARLEAAPAVADLDLRRLEAEVAGQVSRFTDLLKGNPSRARQALKKLLTDRVTFTPTEAEGKRVYAFKGVLSYGAMLEYVTNGPRRPPPPRRALRAPVLSHRSDQPSTRRVAQRRPLGRFG